MDIKKLSDRELQGMQELCGYIGKLETTHMIKDIHLIALKVINGELDERENRKAGMVK